MFRTPFALAALTLAALGVLGAAAQSALNYQDNTGWHVRGVFEVLPQGTFRLGTGNKTATAAAGAATLNNLSGVVTSEPLTTAAGATYTLMLADSSVAPTDIVVASTSLGTATTGLPHVETVTPGNGTLTVIVRNATGAAALNGTVTIAFADIKA